MARRKIIKSNPPASTSTSARPTRSPKQPPVPRGSKTTTDPYPSTKKAAALPEERSDNDGRDAFNDDEDSYVDTDEEEVDSDVESQSEEEREEEDDSDDDGFEDQGSSSEEDDHGDSNDDSESESEIEIVPLNTPPPPTKFVKSSDPRSAFLQRSLEQIHDSATIGHNASLLHLDDLSSDDEEGNNTIGRVPLHWYDEYDHIGYDTTGQQIKKSSTPDGTSTTPNNLFDDLTSSVPSPSSDPSKKFEIYDALNAKSVTLTPRDVEIIRRVQSGAYAHPEFDATPDYVPYFSGVPEKSALNSDRVPSKSSFRPSKWEALQVRRMLKKLKDGDVDMDYLLGKKKSMSGKNEKGENDRPYLMWTGEEEDSLLYRKGPAHVPAAKAPPPSHAESYRPPPEYVPTPSELSAWGELDVHDRPHGLVVPRVHPNMRSVSSYPFALRERFERCLDLYLAPRELKRRLNIDPESLVPAVPKARDLRPYPESHCVSYPHEGGEMVRDVSVSPCGGYVATGSGGGMLRVFEVHTGRKMQAWDLGGDGGGDGGTDPSPVTAVAWNPVMGLNVILACVGTACVVVDAGVGGEEDVETTRAKVGSSLQAVGGKEGEVKWFKVRGEAEIDLGMFLSVLTLRSCP